MSPATNPAAALWFAVVAGLLVLAVSWVRADKLRQRDARRALSARTLPPVPNPDVVFDQLAPMDDQAEYWAKWEREFSDDRGRA